MTTLLPKLLQRADYLAVENGLIVLCPKSGDLATSDKWLNENRERVINEILTATGKEGYFYMSYSTGYYLGANKGGGITLQFSHYLTGTSHFICYNADLTRKRNTKTGIAGERLPKGRFIALKGSSFVKLWRSTGLAIPRRLSSFHDCMGKLKGVIFTGEVTGDQFIKGTLEPIRISFDEISNSVLYGSKTPDKNLTKTRQFPDNDLTRTPDKEMATAHTGHDLQPNPSTGNTNHGIKVKGITGIRKSSNTSNKVSNQSTDEWLDDYSSGN